jgi:ferredoxin
MVIITVFDGDDKHEIKAEQGDILRDVLLAHGFSPYTNVTCKLNCGGRGLCATCGVWIDEDVTPEHWHDKAADAFGYPRLSCQIKIEQDMTVRLLTDKVIWGGRDTDKARLFNPRQ